MIRDAHDFRAGIHDRLLRKLTGRSYSALVHPVARDFPIETMREGDVFFHNDVYRSEGGIGHLPDLCVTVPVFAGSGSDRRVVAFVQAFGHHDDIGGAVPGSMPSHATSGLRGGPDGAADQAVGRRRARPGGADDHDPQLADARVAVRRPRRRVLRLPDGRAPARRARSTATASTPSRPASTRSSTAPPQTYRREILAKIPVGTWVWEDYAEHDGVDEPMLHTQRITLTRTAADDPDGERLVLDFAGTGPQAKGPINHCGDYSRRGLPQEVAGPDPAQPGRHPGADGRARRQRGRRAAASSCASRLRGPCSPRSSRRRRTHAPS